MPVVRSASVEVINQAVDDLGVAQPAALQNVKGRGVIQVGIRLARPRNVIKEFENVIALRADLPDVGPEELPAIVVDLLYLGIVDFEEWDVAEKPRGIGAAGCWLI